MRRLKQVLGAMAIVGCGVNPCASLGQPGCEAYWTSSGTPVPAFTDALAAFDDGSGPTLYSSTSSVVRKWTGQAWQPLPTTGWGPMLQQVYGLRVIKTAVGDQLMITVQRTPTGGETPYPGLGDKEFVPMVFRGNRWEPIVNHRLFKNVASLRYVDIGTGPAYYGVTYVYDGFGNVLRNLVRRWTGDGWVDFGVTDGSSNTFLTSLDFGQGPALYLWAQGSSGFSHVSGVGALGLAKWNGQQWTAPWPERVWAAGKEVFVETVESGSPIVYGFFFANVNGVLTKGIGRYDGMTFRGIGGGELGPGQVGGPTSLAVMDAGWGPDLFVGGGFPMLTGGIQSPGIGRWDGQFWHAVGAGVSSAFSTELTVVPGPRGPNMFMLIPGGPGFGGGISTPNTLALYVGCPNCYANCDLSPKSPSLTANDFMCFMSKFLVRDPYANCTVDATIDILDFQCFINKFAAGCP